MRRFVAMIGTIALVSGLAIAVAAQPASAAQSGTLTWQAPQRTDPPRGVNSISCVSKTLCRAGGASDQILRWDGHTWQNGDRFPDDAAGIDGMSCTSTQFCAAMELVHVASNRVAYRPVTRNTDGTWNVSATTHLLANPRFPGYNSPIPDPVSCVSATFCMLVTADDGYQIWNGKTWTSPVVFQKETVLRYTDVSCASATMCVAVGDTHWTGTGKTVYTWNGRSWSGPRYIEMGNFIEGLSCATTTFCMVVNGARSAIITPSHISSLKRLGVEATSDISCTSPTFCISVGSGSILWNGKAWSGPHRFGIPSPGLVSCSSTSFCVAITDDGLALDRVDGSWQKQRTVQKGITVGYGSGTYARNDVSCGSEQLCVLTDDSSATFGYDGTSWSGPHVISPLTGRVAVSCVSDAFCAAGSTDGLVQFRRDGHWSSATKVVSDDDQGVAAISCVSTTFCGLRDGYGGFYVWNGSRWSVVGQPRSFNYGNTLSCVSDGCVYTLDDGSRSGDGPELAQTYVYSNSTGTLTSVGAEIPSPTNISCTSLTFCLNSGYSTVYGGGPSSGVEQFDGTSWQAAPTADGGVVDGSDVSCTSSTFCVVVGGRWESTWDGTQLSAEQQILDVPVVSGENLDAVSCRPTLCVAASTGGWTIEAHQE